jgi:citrate synthase
MASETLTITDNRTGKKYEIPIRNGAIKATDLFQIKVAEDDGLVSYDPGFMNTASCQSKITYIDGDKGILRYRGYPIEQIAEKSNYLETAYLILHGELPTQSQLADWTHHITYHSIIHENIKKLIDGFHHDAHPMGILVSTVAALSTFYPGAKKSSTRSPGEIKPIALSARCRHWPASLIATAWVCPILTRTTT